MIDFAGFNYFNLLELTHISGDRGIRTLDTVSRIHTFQACLFNHSSRSPYMTKQPAYAKASTFANATVDRSAGVQK